HRRNEGFDAGHRLEAIAVGLPLVETRVGVERGHQQKREYGRDQNQQRQIGKIGHGLEHVAPLHGVAQNFVGQPEAEERDSRLHNNALQNVAVHVMPEFVREHSFDFVVRIVVQQGVGENDAPGRAEAGQRGVGLLAFLGKMPLINTSHARAGAFAQNDQAALEFLVLERFEFVKNREKHNRRELREQYKESEEN